MPSFDVVVLGSANLDLVATAPRLPAPGETVLGTSYAEHAGGKGLNQAVAAARSGATVAMIAALGDDDAGRTLRRVMVDAGIDVRRVVVVDARATGRAVITVDSAGENSIVVIPGANGDVVGPEVPPARIVLAQLEIPIGAVIAGFAAGRAVGARTILNPAPAPPDGIPDELLSLCDLVVPNEHELDLIGGVDRLLDAGVGAVVVTRGAAGVSVNESPTGTASTAESWSVAAYPVTPVDTTGAGDAFCGALAARLAAGDDLASAVRFAAAAGALATTVQGAVPSLASRMAIQCLVDAGCDADVDGG